MWKLLPVCLLASCTLADRQSPAGGGQPSQQPAIVRQVELPLVSSAPSAVGHPARMTFQRQGLQGWLDASGAWHIEGEVHHARLRCATYEMGVQLGSGRPACSEPEWLTGVEYVTRVKHCNGASRLHAGGGQFFDVVDRFEVVSCVRVLVRCEGAC